MDLRMWRPVLLFLSLILIGVVGFHIIEDLSFLDSLYMTVITVFTVGFREIKEPLSPIGQVFTIFIILGGVGSVMYAFTMIAEFGMDDLAWCIMNPRSDLRTNSFG